MQVGHQSSHLPPSEHQMASLMHFKSSAGVHESKPGMPLSSFPLTCRYHIVLHEGPVGGERSDGCLSLREAVIL